MTDRLEKIFDRHLELIHKYSLAYQRLQAFVNERDSSMLREFLDLYQGEEE
tara:strand:- start:772 stop:924 length:153 start_codon:yes stop_codon:yes gene_type:complete